MYIFVTVSTGNLTLLIRLIWSDAHKVTMSKKEL